MESIIQPRMSESFVWKYFVKHADLETATCYECNTQIKCRGWSTSGLIRHLRNKHKIDKPDKRKVGENSPTGIKRQPYQQNLSSFFVQQEACEEIVVEPDTLDSISINFISKMPDLADRMGMDGGRSSSPSKMEGSSNYLTCSPLISAMSGMHEDMMSGAGPSSSSQDTGESEAMQGDYDQDDIDVKSEPVFNVEPEICEDESQTNTQSSCDRRSSQSSPAPAGMAGPYLLKKETHCTTILDQLLRDDTFCDVTLTAEGQSMRAHKIVLCLASAYFRQVLNKEPTVQNVIVFRDIKFMELKNLINFIYTGEATVDAADLESFMKTAEMLEVTSLCDGQRKIPKNLIPKQKEPDNEKGKTTFASKRSAHNSCVSPPPSKARKIDDTPKCAPKSATHPSTSGGGIQYQPQLILHTTTPIKTEPPSEEEQTEDYSTFEESEMPSPTCQLSVTPPSVDPGSSSDKLPVGKCPFCPSSQHLLKGLELTNHMSTYHPEKTVFTCETCSLVFLKKGAFEAHQDDCNR